MSRARVTDSVDVPARPRAVWNLIADPHHIPILDPRLSLLSASGEPGSAGSTYVLRTTQGRRSVEMHYRVVEAASPHTLAMTVTINGKESGTQHADVQAKGEGSLLTWTTTTVAPFGTVTLLTRVMRKEMASWLQSIAVTAASRR